MTVDFFTPSSSYSTRVLKGIAPHVRLWLISIHLCAAYYSHYGNNGHQQSTRDVCMIPPSDWLACLRQSKCGLCCLLKGPLHIFNFTLSGEQHPSSFPFPLLRLDGVSRPGAAKWSWQHGPYIADRECHRAKLMRMLVNKQSSAGSSHLKFQWSAILRNELASLGSHWSS